MSVNAYLERRLGRRKREHARAWQHYTNCAQRGFHADVVRKFRHKADVAIARYDECRLIMNALKKRGR